MSSHVEKGDLPTHKKLPALKLKIGNCFQNMGEFVASKDLNPLRIRRQTRPKKAKNPTGYVSTFNTFGMYFIRYYAAFAYEIKMPPTRWLISARIKPVLVVVASTLRRSEVTISFRS